MLNILFDRAAYGYDVNSEAFKQWQAQQQQQYSAQYPGYAQAYGDAAAPTTSVPPPSDEVAPPPPPTE
jgi:hypothetical protein